MTDDAAPARYRPGRDTSGVPSSRDRAVQLGNVRQARLAVVARGRDTSLLTGDIGSGKSTLVDALTTLLLPAHKIAYNKAAGAESKSAPCAATWKGTTSRSGTRRPARPRRIGLRDHRSYSVILGVFAQRGRSTRPSPSPRSSTRRTRTGQPDRFFVTSDKRLSIAGRLHRLRFGPDANCGVGSAAAGADICGGLSRILPTDAHACWASARSRRWTCSTRRCR